MRIFAVAALFVLFMALPALAAEVDVLLTGGDVTGAVRGQGTADVSARVTNTGSREVTGLRIAVYYSTVDLPPANPDTADWRIHEFIFEPPLQPGKSTTLRFKDEDAAEYVLIEVRFAATGMELSYNDRSASLEYPLEDRGGVTYIASRDLVGLVGGGLSYDGATFEVVLQRDGIELRFKGNTRVLKVNGQRTELAGEIIEIDGRSFLPLEEFCSQLNIAVEHDTAAKLIKLSD